MSISKVKQLEQLKLKQAKKSFTRAKAERLLANGTNPSEERFTKHANYHVRRRSFVLRRSPMPDNETDRAKLMADLHIKPKPVAQVEAGDTRTTEEQIASV